MGQPQRVVQLMLGHPLREVHSRSQANAQRTGANLGHLARWDGLLCGLVVGGLLDEVLNDAVGFIDVFESAMPQTVGEIVIFFFGDVVMRLIE